ncbi:MAG TPA: DUF2007 domain-containing protein [Nitriliruptorales bacterium]
MDTSQGTAVVGSCSSRLEAELQRHVLEQAGIPSSLGSDDVGGMHPELAFTRCATHRVIVPASQVERARAVLADFEPADPGIDEIAAQVGPGSHATFWIALLIAAILAGVVISNTLNVFTGT